MFDYVVVGLGPTGITIGLHLLQTNKKVLFIETEGSIGGCWKTSYTQQGYFTEHSPKVLSKTGTKTFNKLLNYLEVDPQYKELYLYSHFSSIFEHIRKHFTFYDLCNFIIYFVLYLIAFNDKKITVEEWCNEKNLSDKSKIFINIICITVSNTNDKLSMHSLIQFMITKYRYFINLNQLYNTSEWLNKSYEKIKKNNNFKFLFNTSVTSLNITKHNNKINYIITNNEKPIYAKSFILCTPLRSLYKIMKLSNEPNWFKSMDMFKYFTDRSSYTGIGFQLHYDKKVILIDKSWCWSCFGDWKVIVIDKTHLLKRISFDKSIKQVLSCVIVDLDTKSKYLRKSVNECGSVKEIVDEGIRQMGKSIQTPKKVTYSPNIFKSSDFGWESNDSSFSHSMGSIPWKGKINNLYSVGPHNTDEVVIIDTAIDNAVLFSKTILKTNSLF
jgi:hypothetical protein